MKNTNSTLFIFLLLFPVLLKAQWNVVRWDHANFFNKVSAIDSSDAFISGIDPQTNQLLVIRTNDSGANWDTIYSPTLSINSSVSDLFFLNKDTGFLGGRNTSSSLLLKTVDNGNTWTPITPLNASTSQVNSIYFLDSYNGFISIADTLYKTNNGGISWIAQSVSFAVSDLFWIDMNNGYAAGSNASNGSIMKTIDGGQTWNTLLTVNDPLLFVSNLDKLNFINASIGFTKMNDKLYRTLNGGIVWDTISINGASYINDFQFMSADTGHVLINGTDLLLTVDGGLNWTLEYSTTWNLYGNYSFNTFDFAGKAGFAGGTNGIIKKYTFTGIAGLKEEKLNISSSIYPNPFTTSATIRLSSEIRNGIFSIQDVSGRKIKDLSFSGKEIVIEREELNSGIYFYRISSNENVNATGKLIIQ